MGTETIRQRELEVTVLATAGLQDGTRQAFRESWVNSSGQRTSGHEIMMNMDKGVWAGPLYPK